MNIIDIEEAYASKNGGAFLIKNLNKFISFYLTVSLANS